MLNLDAAQRTDLFRIAERINPKRSFLFVSTILGRHIPVRPSEHMGAVSALACAVHDRIGDADALVMGYAETAVGLGAGVARALSDRTVSGRISYLTTTRHLVPGREWLRFTEDHSHAASHHVLFPDPGVLPDFPDAALVLVDDESTTGSTFAELAGTIHEKGVRFSRVILVTLTDWSSGKAVEKVSAACGGMRVETVSLASGRWDWDADDRATLLSLPGGRVPETPRWSPDEEGPACYRAPRLGITHFAGPNLDVLQARGLVRPEKGSRVLVLGTGENVWAPMLLAEEIEARGADAFLVATTRSPVIPGEAIREKGTFSDHFGEGIDMHLHNVIPEQWDHIILMTETRSAGICPALRRFLGRGQVVCGRGYVTEIRPS